MESAARRLLAACLVVAASSANSRHVHHAHPTRTHAHNAHAGRRLRCNTTGCSDTRPSRQLGCKGNGTAACSEALAAAPRLPREDRWGWRELCGFAAGRNRSARSGFTPCEHKSLLLPRIVPLEAAMGALFFVVAALALAAGVGGGGIFVPSLNLALRFTPHVAVGLSQSLICGGALGALLVNTRLRHPTEDRPLIDYALAAFLAPAEMAGAQVGVLLNQALPSLLILVAMAALLGTLAVRTLSKGRRAWAAQRRAAATGVTVEEGRLLHSPTAAAAEGSASESRPQPPPAELAGGGGDDDGLDEQPHETAALEARAASPTRSPPPPGASVAAPPAPQDAEGRGWAAWGWPSLAGMLDEGAHAAPAAHPPSARALAAEARRASPDDVTLLLGVWSGLIALLLLRGGKGAPSLLRIPRCGTGYWLATGGGVCWLLAVSVLAGRRLTARERARSAAGFAYAKAGDVRWDGSHAARCLRVTLLAGVVAGLMGVGGGLVLGPLMLELAILPEVSAATTSTMVLLTSSSAAAVFLLGGIAPYDYALALGAIAMCGGYAGREGVARLVRKYRASALLILLLGALIGASMLATTAAGLLDLRRKLEGGRLVASLRLRPPCNA